MILFDRFANHENSKKHKENVAAIKAYMQEEDEEFLDEEIEEDDVGEDAEVSDERTDAEKAGYTLLKEDDNEEDEVNIDEDTEDGLYSRCPSKKSLKSVYTSRS